MSEMFSNDWMKGFMDAWNSEPGLSGELEKIGFNSVIAYGIDGEDQPRGYIKIENGHAVDAGAYDSTEVNWDLRASEESWGKWITKPPGMMGLGTAYTTRKLKFNVGDYGAMVKDPRMAGPFVKSFAVMGKVG
ncbi:MAG: SCP-2 sterol transfer family protein [Gammaproteobacteria bacterium]|nr:MAG: SCP-2 sterol transfer family protein [Gammaproteobacteria bacterium]